MPAINPTPILEDKIIGTTCGVETSFSVDALISDAALLLCYCRGSQFCCGVLEIGGFDQMRKIDVLRPLLSNLNQIDKAYNLKGFGHFPSYNIVLNTANHELFARNVVRAFENRHGMFDAKALMYATLAGEEIIEYPFLPTIFKDFNWEYLGISKHHGYTPPHDIHTYIKRHT